MTNRDHITSSQNAIFFFKITGNELFSSMVTGGFIPTAKLDLPVPFTVALCFSVGRVSCGGQLHAMESDSHPNTSTTFPDDSAACEERMFTPVMRLEICFCMLHTNSLDILSREAKCEKLSFLCSNLIVLHNPRTVRPESRPGVSVGLTNVKAPEISPWNWRE